MCARGSVQSRGTSLTRASASRISSSTGTGPSNSRLRVARPARGPPQTSHRSAHVHRRSRSPRRARIFCSCSRRRDTLDSLGARTLPWSLRTRSGRARGHPECRGLGRRIRRQLHKQGVLALALKRAARWPAHPHSAPTRAARASPMVGPMRRINIRELSGTEPSIH
ncbi:hypothetical protein B0H15DRAFT_407535 [Mycena belliarum]|uniref:Uncharacterized protein n=1 Tax=Mycena belliarum TaxID=1033014 RepID=A0AAD6XWK4_9AGAR|nr:hypothetical protein B0H15DRAFT_407535 [Mycena belliae]